MKLRFKMRVYVQAYDEGIDCASRAHLAHFFTLGWQFNIDQWAFRG